MYITSPKNLRTATLALGACFLLAACGKKDENVASNTPADSAAVNTTAPGTTATAAGGEMAGPSATGAATGDAGIWSAIGTANASEIVSSKLAQTKATNASVKAFANDMVKDHTAMQKDADKLATALNVTPRAGDETKDLSDDAKEAMEDLTGEKAGKDWDKKYVDAQVDMHQKTLDNLQNFQGQSSNAELKTLITKAIPKVQTHLQRAKDLQGKLDAMK
jgi:putative membrane protein